MRGIPDNLGFILLAIWLIITGLMQLTSGPGLVILLGLLALVAGVLILLQNIGGYIRK